MFQVKAFISFLLSVFLLSMFFRTEYFSIPAFGFGLKLFHIVPMLVLFLLVSAFQKPIWEFSYISKSAVIFVVVFFVVSIVQILVSGVTPGYFRGVFYCIIFFSSFFLHAAFLGVCKNRGLNFEKEYLDVISVAIAIILFVISVKNLFYFPDLLQQYLSGELRAKTPWNFLNFGQSMNNEVVFVLMFIPFVYRLGFKVFWPLFAMCMFMVLITRVDAAYLYILFWIGLFFCEKIFSGNKNGLVFFVFLILFLIAPFFIIYSFLGMEFEKLSGGELGRYVLWNHALESFHDSSLISKLFGGSDVSEMIVGYDDMASIGHNVMDYHNLFFNALFEYGFIVLILYIFLVFVPLLHKSVQMDLTNPVVVFVLFTLLSSWFTPRGFDYFLWFFIPGFWALAFGCGHSYAKEKTIGN